jgi:hypothetical protein
MDEAHPSIPEKFMIIQSSTIMFEMLDLVLTYFVPALTATIREASNVVIREALIKGGGTGEKDIGVRLPGVGL